MDGSNLNQMPNLGEVNSGAWLQVWDGDESSISGLNLDHSRELHNLVEDKDIAARAVAFVVNSTRKGIVPLCADVASLLRTKRRLENKIHRLRNDNEVLRSSLSASTRTSQSTSPVPNSLHSCDNRPHCRCSQSLCSDCSSQCSSLVGNSPGLDGRAQRTHITSAFTAPPSHYQAHCLDPDHHHHAIQHTTPEARRHTCSNRKNSLPEIVSQPGEDVLRIKPRPSLSKGTNTVSIETQCNLHSNTMLEAQFRESLQVNSKLAEQLGVAKKEIELLKGKLKELEMNQLARDTQDQFVVVNECGALAAENRHVLAPSLSPITSNIKEDSRATESRLDKVHQPEASNYSTGTVKKKSPASPVTVASPLEGCICNNCTIMNDTSQERNMLETSFIKPKLPVDVGSHIVMKGDRTGYVRYLGHLDGVGQQRVVFAGIELDAPVGRHDGILNGRRYFTCVRDCGIFVPLHEVICVIPQKDIEVKQKRKTSPTYTLQRCLSDTEQLNSHQKHQSDVSIGLFQRRASDLDLRSKVKTGSFGSSAHQHKKEQKEIRFLGGDTKDLKLPNDSNLTEGHLV